jgi:hypothetical protein
VLSAEKRAVGAYLLLLGLRRPPWIWVTGIDVAWRKKFIASPKSGRFLQIFTNPHDLIVLLASSQG